MADGTTSSASSRPSGQTQKQLCLTGNLSAYGALVQRSALSNQDVSPVLLECFKLRAVLLMPSNVNGNHFPTYTRMPLSCCELLRDCLVSMPAAVMCRNTVGMTVGFLQSYSLLVIRTCHKRGVHAMGGMAAQIPIKNDPDANNAAIAKVLRQLAHLLTSCMSAILSQLSHAY